MLRTIETFTAMLVIFSSLVFVASMISTTQSAAIAAWYSGLGLIVGTLASLAIILYKANQTTKDAFIKMG